MARTIKPRRAFADAAVGDEKVSEQIPLSPRIEFRQLTRRRILDAGRRCFKDKGFTSTTMEEIAKRAGVGRTVIYQYFLNKSQIINDIIEEDEHLFLKAFITAMPVDFDHHDAVRAGASTMLALYRKEGDLMRVMAEAASVDSTVSDWLERSFQRYLNGIVDQTSRDAADHENRNARLQVRTWICIAAMDSLFQRLLDPRWNFDENIAVAEITSLWSNLVGRMQHDCLPHAQTAKAGGGARADPPKRVKRARPR